MWKDIYVILFIIMVSYIFTVSETKKFDKQMMFIMLALMIIILYKVIHYRNNSVNNGVNDGVSEGFININASDIQNWLSSAPDSQGGEVEGPSTNRLVSEAETINENLQKTLEEVSKLKAVLLEKENKDKNVNDDYLSSLDTRNMQTMQNKELQKLQTDIENAKVMLSQLEIAKSTKKYPKIPVYSSCVVSNADGTYNVDSQDTNQVQKNMQTQQPTIAGNTNGINPPVVGGVQQTSQSNEMLNKMLSNILQNGVNLNFT